MKRSYRGEVSKIPIGNESCSFCLNGQMALNLVRGTYGVSLIRKYISHDLLPKDFANASINRKIPQMGSYFVDIPSREGQLKRASLSRYIVVSVL